MTNRKKPEELINEVDTLVQHAKSNNRLGESYIIESIGKLIESNARVEDETTRLITKLQEFNKKSDKQATVMIWLTRLIVVLTFIMLVGVIVQFLKK